MSVKISSEKRGSERLPHGRAGLAFRRRRNRRNFLIVLAGIGVVAVSGILFGLQQPAVRISRIDISGADTSLSAIAMEVLQGSFLGIIPRDSIIFFPSSDIRARMLAADTDIATVSIFRSGFNAITITVVNRVPIAKWCGEKRVLPAAMSSTTTESEQCYIFDDSGYVFATTTNVPLVNTATLYAPFTSSSSPLHSVLPQAEKLPAVFNFGRQVAGLGSAVTAIAIRDGEVDTFLTSGTRLTYVLGHEQNAYTALLSALPNMNIKDGSVQYVDLRFDGKVYVKKQDATVPQ